MVLLRRAQQEMDVIAHQAITVQVEGLALLQIGHGLQKGQIIAFAAKNRLPVVAAVDHVIHKPVVDRS